MRIVFATDSDYGYIRNRDLHISESLILSKIKGNEIYILRNQDESNIGWMRYGYFWEEQMKQKGFNLIMTSTQADEGAQHFYRKLGYKDAGCLIIDTQPLEILLTKNLN